MLEGLMHCDPNYDDDLYPAVQYLLGREQDFKHGLVPTPSQLKSGSTLFSELAKVILSDSRPEMRPVSVHRIRRGEPSRTRQTVSTRTTQSTSRRTRSRVSTTQMMSTRTTQSISRRTRSGVSTTSSRRTPRSVERQPVPASSLSASHSCKNILRGLYSTLWCAIEVTNIPSSQGYKYTGNDKLVTQFVGSVQSKARFETNCSIKKIQQQRYYWLLLGKYSIQKRADRCFVCAAAVAFTIVQDPKFDAYNIIIAGSPSFGHHFISLVTEEAIEQQSYDSAIVIDIWHANLQRAKSWRDAIFTNVNKYPYKARKAGITFYFDVNERESDRKLASSLTL